MWSQTALEELFVLRHLHITDVQKFLKEVIKPTLERRRKKETPLIPFAFLCFSDKSHPTAVCVYPVLDIITMFETGTYRPSVHRDIPLMYSQNIPFPRPGAVRLSIFLPLASNPWPPLVPEGNLILGSNPHFCLWTVHKQWSSEDGDKSVCRPPRQHTFICQKSTPYGPHHPPARREASADQRRSHIYTHHCEPRQR